MSGTNAASAAGTAAVVPIVWTFLGYEFEAGAMLVALVACFLVCTRRIVVNGRFKFSRDVPVTFLALIVTAGCIIHFRPEPLFAIVYGMGIGAVGEGLITMAEKWVSRTGLFGAETDRLPVPQDMKDLVRKLNGDKGEEQ